MSDARLDSAGDGRWVLGGDLDFSTVPTVWPAVERVLSDGAVATLSLRDVQHANSAALVMLIEALDVARRVGCELSLVDIPADVVDLARMSSCEDLIAAA